MLTASQRTAKALEVGGGGGGGELSMCDGLWLRLAMSPELRVD